ADVVVSERLWLSGGARFTRRWSGSVEVRIPDADDPLAAGVSRALRVEPGDGWEADVAPRFQLTESIALGGVLAFAARGADAFGEGVGEPDALLASALRGDRRAALLAVGGRFTTVPAWRRGSRILPLEAELLFHRTLSGRGGVPRTNGVEAMARVYQRLWGGRPSAAPAAMEPPAR
ncbi:MAG: hypothetical protein M3409_09040, partial [Gemmatimonadota bacterium]|nr:hypothetical protein [Gemmatimonadota bacterium]